MVVDSFPLRHTRAPTVIGGDHAWLSEVSGYVVLRPNLLYKLYLPVILKGSTTAASRFATRAAYFGQPTLRVPVYAALRPASQMQAVQTALDFTAMTTTNISLMGIGLNTGPAYPTDTLSLVSAFELAEANPNDPGKIDRAELHYLGVGNNFGAAGSVTATTLFFAIAAHGSWSVPLAPEAQFKVFIDVDRNGTDDWVLANDTLGGDRSNGVFYTRLTNLSINASSYQLPVNYFPASTYDTVLFNTNAMILAVPANAIGLTSVDPQFRYRVESYAANIPIAASAVHTYTAYIPGLDFSGGLSGTPLWPDLTTTTIPVKFNAAAYATDGSLGALVLHFHNAESSRTQVIPIIAP